MPHLTDCTLLSTSVWIQSYMYRFNHHVLILGAGISPCQKTMYYLLLTSAYECQLKQPACCYVNILGHVFSIQFTEVVGFMCRELVQLGFNPPGFIKKNPPATFTSSLQQQSKGNMWTEEKNVQYIDVLLCQQNMWHIFVWRNLLSYSDEILVLFSNLFIIIGKISSKFYTSRQSKANQVYTKHLIKASVNYSHMVQIIVLCFHFDDSPRQSDTIITCCSFPEILAKTLFWEPKCSLCASVCFLQNLRSDCKYILYYSFHLFLCFSGSKPQQHYGFPVGKCIKVWTPRQQTSESQKSFTWWQQ